MQAEKSPFADFSSRLAALISRNFASEAEAARQTGITPQAINVYVRENRLPKAEQLYALAQALGVTMEYLLTGSGAPASWAVNEAAHDGAEARRLCNELMGVARRLDQELKKY